DVAVEIAIARIARVTFVPAPDLFGGIEVATERGDAVWGEDRGEHAVTWTGPGVEHAVRVRDKPTNVRLLQNEFHAGGVSAFGQPDAARIATKAGAVVVARRENLGADRRRMIGQQRQQRVRGGAGDDFQSAAFLEFAERADQIPAVGDVGLADVDESLVIHFRERTAGGFPLRAVGFFFGQLDE